MSVRGQPTPGLLGLNLQMTMMAVVAIAFAILVAVLAIGRDTNTNDHVLQCLKPHGTTGPLLQLYGMGSVSCGSLGVSQALTALLKFTAIGRTSEILAADPLGVNWRVEDTLSPHDFNVDSPTATELRARPRCTCRCGCRCRPSRRVACRSCLKYVGPGCCLAVEDTISGHAFCHLCWHR